MYNRAIPYTRSGPKLYYMLQVEFLLPFQSQLYIYHHMTAKSFFTVSTLVCLVRLRQVLWDSTVETVKDNLAII